ncbi:MAG: amylo-alpha-1,6-glucosidase, partial [Dehalococcoidia bacterium]|nr:amylo-alpha-1,6-glucosidase [Dehalococcoidia bacterium]
RQTKITFSPKPAEVNPQGVTYRLSLRHRESTSFRVTITINNIKPSAPFIASFDHLTRDYREWMRECTQVESPNEFLASIVHRCLADVRLLQTGSHEDPYVAAGIPWFATLFGRDLLVTSLQVLAYNTNIAKRSLLLLAKYQGKKVDPWRDEEPGKILHELRLGEMAHLDEVPFTPYYGSVDSTPLFLLLAGEFYSWTGDLGLMRELEPHLLAALNWLENYGDRDGDGYIDYEKRSAKGLVNQGWKDSADAIVNPDGTLAYPPIALVEVQGYVYAAKERLARVFAHLGKVELALRLSQEAQDLKARFNRDFWLEKEKFYALALDGFNKPVATIASNPGHALWAGIVDKERAEYVVNRLMANDMSSGWGIRTLSSRAPRYNPLGYHMGTIWPHDNSIIAMGFKRYGFEEEIDEVATALYDACRAFDYYRLPELFCGVPRTRYNVPVRYPIACSPQAWAAGSMLQLLQAILGLEPNAPEEELSIVSPRLPSWLERIRLSNLSVGKSKVDLIIHRRNGRTEVDIAAIEGKLKVSVVS